jgi:uncharacterized lipoprotein NlpE involved in copper resistance
MFTGRGVIMKRIFFAGTILLVFFAWSCAKQSEPAPASASAADSFAHIAGEYRGILPCADCEGIDTVIRLENDGTCTSRIRYLGKSDEEVFEWTGTFELDSRTNVLTLKSGQQYGTPVSYVFKENTLTQLDMEGNVIGGDFPDLYILKKQ